jgi:CO/xanthine dehydrogenase Mo-binding subunit
MTVSRRDFLKTSGALIVTFGLAPESVFAQRLDGASSNQVDGWVSVNADGTITAFTGKCELGHGLYTAQTQLVAEELSVPFNRVRLIQCDTTLTPDQGTTSGAQSHPTNFNQGALALGCATAREALLDMASKRLGAPADQLTVKDSIVSLKSDASKKGQLFGTDRWKKVQSHVEYSREAEESERVDRARHSRPAYRASGNGHRRVRVRSQCSRSRDAAWPGRTATGIRRDSHERR